MATRKPRTRAEKSKTASALLEALKFISIAQHNDFPGSKVYHTHCRITDGTLTAFDGGLTVGIYVDETLTCCPHTNTLIKALDKCADQISITLLDNGKLSVKSGKFRAVVPCTPFHTLGAVQPDPPCATLTDSLKTALGAACAVSRDGEPMPACGVLIQAGTVCASDRIVFIEAWHGIDLPTVFIPRVSANAIANSQKLLKAFGFSENSATFFFEDDSFIKTQLLVNEFPDYSKIFIVEPNPWPLPAGFYEGIDAITPFADSYVYFRNGKMLSEPVEKNATTYDVEGLPKNTAFNLEKLKMIRPFANGVHFNATDKSSYFFSQDGLIRGAIAKVYYDSDKEDDIPF